MTLDKPLADLLSVTVAYLSAATVELGDGLTVLLLAADRDEPIHVTRRGKKHIEFAEAVAAETAEDTVDETTKAFLLLKQRLFEEGAFNLWGPLSAEEVEALGAEEFEALERLLDK